MLTKEFTLTREEAARRLNISIRTLDRYIRRNYFNVKKIDRSIWISRPSFENYYAKNIQSESQGNDQSPQEEAIIPVSISPSLHEHSYEKDLSMGSFYKEIYQELKNKYDEQQKRLEGAHYRVGQLEAQIKSMVPMIEFKKEQNRLLLVAKQQEDVAKEANITVNRLSRLFRSERLNKQIYTGLVYLLLFVQIAFWVILKSS
ncbi:MAG: hypothetical protein UT55_C0087G0005 [Candidatus Peregrinibacteria bacterium GW2011_GWE2_39_6]|nr:MAG: hypothetical protein UT36_C0001G0053 [Candidatus Peregrinibacteria bacterium GW2011_GWF2_39_17]KKR23608.1 MAG: hypothetical protein UT55_C0087G0005 [Candidatus Peregrinibacteria bacterium GW2011_GWE2_39_6]HCW32395.1 hypothetical protein [Candidatus Peregrinibacteria bacterium]